MSSVLPPFLMYLLAFPWVRAYFLPGSAYRSGATQKHEKAVALRTWGGYKQPGGAGASVVPFVVGLHWTPHPHGHPVLLLGVHTISWPLLRPEPSLTRPHTAYVGGGRKGFMEGSWSHGGVPQFRLCLGKQRGSTSAEAP